MHVFPIAHTAFDTATAELAGYIPHSVTQDVAPADELAEMSGRNCYRSWQRRNPHTTDNAGYLKQIIDHQHYSVLEHASATFFVEGVSRALLAELTRHRHLSFSINSQRYIDYSGTTPVIPPAVEKGSTEEAVIRDAYTRAVADYTDLTEGLRARGLKRKEAREAARCILPNAAPVDLIVTGNMRAWREVIAKRFHEAADAEIRELASTLLRHLKILAPATFQDFSTDNPAQDERGDGEGTGHA
ncbi:FAD-dependent thymidylate synthase [Streptomyces cacaoi]|uniref:Flavin-dependent thymidylate synthase n=1 Tax=Streptomyces cacaoi TaxID=1898 RepID=A0A4Y3R138_STRCI|nr:FAD-dependent thymidylate synthase [Streptomyces cacaoi]GEB50398.1 flavin-dependent thymidylate synthase [Streptomyces cacaoi]